MGNSRIACKYAPDCKVVALSMMPTVDTRDSYEMFMNHLPELQEVYESLIDDESRRTFYGYWLGNISHQFGELVYSTTPHYITNGFIPEPGAIIIDGGACDGGTAKIFTEMGYKVYAFELDEKNFNSTKKLAEDTGFGASKLDLTGSAIAKITTLDNYVRENNLPRVDFIKLDVETAELSVLRGAAATIARFKPILAISAYHKWDDFWVLMNFAKSIRPDYEFALRQFPERYEGMPTMFGDLKEDYLRAFGIEPDWRDFYECVLFAR